MKTTDPHDSLDKAIDMLLASRPIRPTTNLTERVVASAHSIPAPERKPITLGRVVGLGLPVAAAIAFACTQFLWLPQISEEPREATLSPAEAEEIFLWEEALSVIHPFHVDNVQTRELLSTLDILVFEIES